jgi:hypothetical protein
MKLPKDYGFELALKIRIDNLTQITFKTDVANLSDVVYVAIAPDGSCCKVGQTGARFSDAGIG